MPTARESLLDAAYAALAARPWAGVRMVDVAAEAGVSRQTLYNEFGSKEGLARALVRRETEGYIAGVTRALAEPGAGPGGTGGDVEARVVAAAAWTVRAARTNPLVRAALTGCWSERLPAPAGGIPGRRGPYPGGVSGQPGARADGPPPGPTDLVSRFSDCAMAALEADWPKENLPELGTACATAARLTLSYVVAPAEPEDLTRQLHRAFAHAVHRT
ncbi:TetR family transcriptional regulator [Streptomyces chrestomyceticus JCM 4735]|uniref:TetR family transcriptional regulator n=1 Tax=Streptomyces chrestomyceticus JCM 4735 TaxID=1306181 RepID=A0A7U9PX66_9ACTN|nr:TetR/AcrR family transcriptional regulator [Streptomyces chrestomyceticus]GCD35003.1 TetR family transcriptional regulator [Streptomyces chrestomyceticus JCM 4735]